MKILPILGKFLISLGVGVLLFVAWILWGTGIATERAQNRLSEEYDRLPTLAAPARGGPPNSFRPGPGSPVFKIKIPRIKLNNGKGFVVVEGVGVEDLKLGPGHYPSCRRGFPPPLCTELPEVWPGEKGRVILSGHRTTYAQPFWDLDKLGRGDEIITETRWGNFTYVVTKTKIVDPSDRTIANPAASTFPELVLTTCNPRFSAAQRLIVFSELKEPAPV